MLNCVQEGGLIIEICVNTSCVKVIFEKHPLPLEQSDIAKLAFCSYQHLIPLFITTFIADFVLEREPSVIFECCYFWYFLVLFCVFYISVYLIIYVILNEEG